MTEIRNRWLLILLVLGQFFLLTAQITGPGGERGSLETAMLRVVAPFGSLVASSSRFVQAVTQDAALRRSLVAENRRLRAQVQELQQRAIRLNRAEEDLQYLLEAVEYAREADLPAHMADIVFIDHTSWLQSLVLSVEEGSVQVNQPVVSGDGLVGRVVVAAGPYAKVQLIADRSASVGGMIERTRRQGVVRGAGRGSLELDFVPLQADVRAGDLVVTAGIDGIYPRGIPVGRVVEVEPGDELFHKIRMAPTVDFGVLEVVYLLDREPVPEEVKEAIPDAEP